MTRPTTSPWSPRVAARPLLVSPLLGLVLALGARRAAAQSDAAPPPPLPPAAEEAAAAPTVSAEPPQSATGEANVSANAAATPGAAATTEPVVAASAEPGADLEGADSGAPTAQLPTETPAAAEAALRLWRRTQSLRESSSLSGSTGLLRTRAAGSGDVGTFRLGFDGAFFGQTGFLCGVDVNPCQDPVTGERLTVQDSTSRVQTIVNISITPLPFLESFLSIRNATTSNATGRPSVLQIVGDMSLGVKGFMPYKFDQIFAFGGEAELNLLTGTGGVGLDGGSTGFAFRGLATLDLTRRTQAADRLPFRAHLNVGYRFDNSGALVKDLETTPPPDGRGEPIQRPERFGLNISRVDAFEVALGAEYIHDYFRPFLEWSIDVPSNRQGYECLRSGAAQRGDICLADGTAFNTTPSRLTLGSRVFPWQASGLMVTLAADIGTGATSVFVEEITPEVPYNLWLSLGYSIDTRPPEPVMVEVRSPDIEAAQKPETRRYAVGVVVDAATESPIPGALILYSDPGATGMVGNAEGAFRTADLAPGEYTLKVQAKNYGESECAFAIPEEPSAPAPLPAEPGAPAEAVAAVPVETPTQAEDGSLEVPVVCSLKELPRVGNVVLVVVDAESGAIVTGGSVQITDPLNRRLELTTDNRGSLEFRNVPFGTAQLIADADGYLRGTMPVVVDSRDALKVHVVLNKRPKRPGVKVLPKQVTLPARIEFVGDTDQVSPSSMALVEELAAVLRENAKVGAVEIGVHSDDSGPATGSHQLTQARAEAIRQLLVRLGVAEGQLEAKGYGPDKPLTPNTSDEARAKNNRVEILRK